jgi:hypothetical protein
VKLKLINLEFEGDKCQRYHFIVNNDYRDFHSVKGWYMNGERKDINVPVFSCWLLDKEFKEPQALNDCPLLPPVRTVDDFLCKLLDGAVSCNFEDELTLHLGYMLADKPKPDDN